MNTKKNKNFKKKKVRQPLDKNQLLAYILAGLMIFWTVASVFGFIAYGRTKREKANNIISASAETVEELQNGEIVINLDGLQALSFRVSNTSGAIYSLYGSYQLVVHEDYIYFVTSVPSGTTVRHSLPYYGAVPCFYLPATNITTAPFSFVYYGTQEDLDEYQFTKFTDIRVDYVFFRNGTVLECAISVYFYSDIFVGGSHALEFLVQISSPNSISFTDSTLLFLPYFGVNSILSSDFFYDGSHSAYGFTIADYLNSTDYSSGYDAGYNQGTTDGYADGYEFGYQAGENKGYDIGYDIGYSFGVQEANNYSFDGLLSAVFDVPVITFTSLFNFDILGVNLTTFFLSLLTLAGVLAVVRMLL